MESPIEAWQVADDDTLRQCTPVTGPSILSKCMRDNRSVF